MTEASGWLRTLAFGEPGSGTWGAALALGTDAALACLGADGAAQSLPARLDDSDGEEWSLTGDGLELSVAPLHDPVDVTPGESGIGGFDQTCRVSGRFRLGGTSQEVSSLGSRGRRGGASLDITRYESLRVVTAWFEAGDAVSLAAFRPQGARGQEADVVSATVLDGDLAAAVDDPRLSTTYNAAGWPARAGLELWIGGEDDEHQRLQRVAGEPAGARLEADWNDLAVRVELFGWHTGGHDGAGVYLTARRR